MSTLSYHVKSDLKKYLEEITGKKLKSDLNTMVDKIVCIVDKDLQSEGYNKGYDVGYDEGRTDSTSCCSRCDHYDYCNGN